MNAGDICTIIGNKNVRLRQVIVVIFENIHFVEQIQLIKEPPIN